MTLDLDESARVSKEILKSKIGTPWWESGIFIETEIFQFDYRIEKDIDVGESPIITFSDNES